MDFNAYITNLGKYNEGLLIGQWVSFPTDAETLAKTLHEIGIDNKEYEEWFITDYDIDYDIPGLYDNLSEYPNLDELNYLAGKLEDLDEYERTIVAGAADMSMGTTSEIINITENTDCYISYPVSNHDELGQYLFEAQQDSFRYMVEELEKSHDLADRLLADYIQQLEDGYDPDGLANNLETSVVYTYVNNSFVYEDSSLTEIYSGPDDIPDEYQITAEAMDILSDLVEADRTTERISAEASISEKLKVGKEAAAERGSVTNGVNKEVER